MALLRIRTKAEYVSFFVFPLTVPPALPVIHLAPFISSSRFFEQAFVAVTASPPSRAAARTPLVDDLAGCLVVLAEDVPLR